MRDLCSGDLNQIVQIDTISRRNSNDGQSVVTHVPFLLGRKAAITPVGGGETLFRDIQLQTETRLLVRTWSDVMTRQISTNMTVLFSGKRYGITRVYDPKMTQRELWIECVDQR